MAKFEYMQRAFSSELKPRARLVLQVLVLHCNKEGECFPSIKTIAAKYGITYCMRIPICVWICAHLSSILSCLCSRHYNTITCNNIALFNQLCHILLSCIIFT